MYAPWERKTWKHYKVDFWVQFENVFFFRQTVASIVVFDSRNGLRHLHHVGALNTAALCRRVKFGRFWLSSDHSLTWVQTIVWKIRNELQVCTDLHPLTHATNVSVGSLGLPNHGFGGLFMTLSHDTTIYSMMAAGTIPWTENQEEQTFSTITCFQRIFLHWDSPFVK